MGHNDRTDNTDRLQESSFIATRAPRNKHTSDYICSLRTNDHELKTEEENAVRYLRNACPFGLNAAAIKKIFINTDKISSVFKIPLKTKPTKLTSYPKDTAITVMRNPNRNSNLRRPYLSNRRKVNVSNIVINTPHGNGILKNR